MWPLGLLDVAEHPRKIQEALVLGPMLLGDPKWMEHTLATNRCRKIQQAVVAVGLVTFRVHVQMVVVAVPVVVSLQRPQPRHWKFRYATPRVSAGQRLELA